MGNLSETSLKLCEKVTWDDALQNIKEIPEGKSLYYKNENNPNVQ